CLHLWWGPWSSKPVGGLKKAVSGFDSHTLPLSLFFDVSPDISRVCVAAVSVASSSFVRLSESIGVIEVAPEAPSRTPRRGAKRALGSAKRAGGGSILGEAAGEGRKTADGIPGGPGIRGTTSAPLWSCRCGPCRSFGKRAWSLPPINIFAMGYSNNQNGQLHVTNFINNAVDSHADAPKLWFARQLHAARWPWIMAQVFQGCHDAAANVGREPVQLLFRRWLDDELIE